MNDGVELASQMSPRNTSKADPAAEALISHLVDSLGYFKSHSNSFNEHSVPDHQCRESGAAVGNDSVEEHNHSVASFPGISGAARTSYSPRTVADDQYDFSPIETISREHSTDSISTALHNLTLRKNSIDPCASNGNQAGHSVWERHRNGLGQECGLGLENVDYSVGCSRLKNSSTSSIGIDNRILQNKGRGLIGSSDIPGIWQNPMDKEASKTNNDHIPAIPPRINNTQNFYRDENYEKERSNPRRFDSTIQQNLDVSSQSFVDPTSVSLPTMNPPFADALNTHGFKYMQHPNGYYNNALQATYTQQINAAAQLASVCSAWPPSIQALALAQLQLSLAQQHQKMHAQSYQNAEECLVGLDGKYQPYCHQIITEEMNEIALQLLHKVKNLQMSDPPAVSRMVGKRYFCSLKEVAKVVNSARLILIAPDIRPSLTAHIKPVRLLELVLSAADATGVPYVFVLSRRGIGQVFGREKSMSIVAVMNLEGVEAEYVSLLESGAKGRQAYQVSRLSCRSSSDHSHLPQGNMGNNFDSTKLDYGNKNRNLPECDNAAAGGIGLYHVSNTILPQNGNHS